MDTSQVVETDTYRVDAAHNDVILYSGEAAVLASLTRDNTDDNTVDDKVVVLGPGCRPVLLCLSAASGD